MQRPPKNVSRRKWSPIRRDLAAPEPCARRCVQHIPIRIKIYSYTTQTFLTTRRPDIHLQVVARGTFANPYGYTVHSGLPCTGTSKVTRQRDMTEAPAFLAECGGRDICHAACQDFMPSMIRSSSLAMSATSVMAAADWLMPSAVSLEMTLISSVARAICSDAADCSSAAVAMERT